MAAKKTTITLERVYNVPLRKEFQKVARYKKTRKAVFALRSFLEKHMKSKEVKLSKELNEKMWKDGIKNPPHHIKVSVTKDEKGVVKAELFASERTVKRVSKKTEVKKETKTEPVKEEAKEKKEEPVVAKKAETEKKE